jgi:hypothetical protein
VIDKHKTKVQLFVSRKSPCFFLPMIAVTALKVSLCQAVQWSGSDGH